MKTTVEVGQMILSCPEGFREMDEEEKDAVTMTGGTGVCLTFPDRHIVMTAGYKEINFFSAAILSLKDIMKGTENDIRRMMKPYEYRSEKNSLKDIGPVEAAEIPYTYTARDTKMYGCTYIFKMKRTLYYLHWYTREALREENSTVLKEVLDSIRWK